MTAAASGQLGGDGRDRRRDPEEPAIWAEGLTKRYGGLTAVDHLSMRVPAGTITGFVGPNGAGKSTTMRMLLGLVTPSEGEARVLGHPVGRPDAYLGRVGALIEAPACYPGLTGRRNLRIMAALKGADPARIPALLEQVGLADRADDRTRSYSLGMKQRLGIAMALLSPPELLLLDEPVNGLDPSGIHDVRELLRRLREQGSTVFVSSHLLSEVEQVCDWLVILHKGQRLFEGSTRELLASRQAGFTVATRDQAQLAVVERICAAAGHRTHRHGDKLNVDAPASWAETLNRETMAAGVVLTELSSGQSHLESVFLEITGDGDAADRSAEGHRSERG